MRASNPAGSASHEPTLDSIRDRLESLQDLLGAAETVRIIDVFLESGANTVAALEAASDPAEVACLAHRLAGASLSVGAQGLAERLRACEVAHLAEPVTESVASRAEHLVGVLAEYRKVRDALLELRDRWS